MIINVNINMFSKFDNEVLHIQLLFMVEKIFFFTLLKK